MRRTRGAGLAAPVPLTTYLGRRLHEVAQHSWDVRVAGDPNAVISAESAQLLAEYFAGDLGFLLGILGKADVLDEPALVDIEGSGFALAITDSVTWSRSASGPSATFSGPLEAAIRLIGGRLTPPYTPEVMKVTGNVMLEDLRRVFPGF